MLRKAPLQTTVRSFPMSFALSLSIFLNFKFLFPIIDLLGSVLFCCFPDALRLYLSVLLFGCSIHRSAVLRNVWVSDCCGVCTCACGLGDETMCLLVAVCITTVLREKGRKQCAGNSSLIPPGRSRRSDSRMAAPGFERIQILCFRMFSMHSMNTSKLRVSSLI